MTRSASDTIELYLSAFRSELSSAGAEDADDLVAEIRSLLTEAAGDDPEAAADEIKRLGEPAELARGILAERGLDPASGVSPGVWWRLGIAAPLDIAIGLALPLAAALPLYVAAWFGQPRVASVVIAIALGVAAMAWPFFIWRPWRRGGRTLSPGMTLTGLAVVRAPGFWRLVRIDELRAMGFTPRRRVLLAALTAVVAVAMLAGATFVGFDVGGSWLAEAAIAAEFSGRTPGGGVALETQLQSVVEQVYIGLMGVEGSSQSTSLAHVSPEATERLEPLWQRIEQKGIRAVRVVSPVQIAPGVYRFEVQEFTEPETSGSKPVGSSTFTLGQRQWLRADGAGSDWAVVAIDVGAAQGAE
ncbi:MAG TPA: hypothetical protein VLA05_00810 [Coriobacteriia bacterium]|nr:hypothetical protein [Coriobacteriia bacterium]